MDEPIPEVPVCEQCGNKLIDTIEKKIGGQNKKFCGADCLKLFEINMEEVRITTEERTNKDIHFLKREIEYKATQLKKGIEETRAINQVPGQPAMILDGYKDGLKPAYILENEIEQNEQKIKERRRQIENIKKAREEDAS